ncbi:hypothetical protein [Actinoplanes couchii]|nr:hypothetical protein [Actinoplanes couchii]MDR6318996.1 BRCT domain type II-containing protein [Actinoplanes couchii]
MIRLLALPVVAGAVLLVSACSTTEPVAVTPAPGTTSAAAPAPATPVASPSTAATSDPQKSEAEQQESKGDATFPIGAGTHLVLLHSYDSAKRTAVVEPAELSKDGSAVNGDGSRYTLPVNGSLKVFSTNSGNPDCMNGKGFDITGSCLTDAAWLKKQLGGTGYPVTIANTADFIYEIAEQYRP